MQTSATDLVALLDSIETVRDHPALSDIQKRKVLTELRHQLPAEQLCRFSAETKDIVANILEEAIDGTQTTTKGPAKKRPKTPTKSTKT